MRGICEECFKDVGVVGDDGGLSWFGFVDDVNCFRLFKIMWVYRYKGTSDFLCSSSGIIFS